MCVYRAAQLAREKRAMERTVVITRRFTTESLGIAVMDTKTARGTTVCRVTAASPAHTAGEFYLSACLLFFSVCVCVYVYTIYIGEEEDCY